jgi:vacuolar-type H+-ATPase subunit H
VNTISPQDGERHEGLHLSPAEKADGFAAIMKRLKGRSEQECAQLRAQADAAILGHEAYALGHENLRRGNYVAAKRWLRVAASHSVPGAEQALEEIEVGPTVQEPSPTVIVDVTPDLCSTGASHTAPRDVEKLASLLHKWAEAGLVMDGARAEARQLLAEARRTADELITQAREEADRVRAEAQEQITSERRAIAELLREAEQLQREAKLLVQKASRAAEAPATATRVCIDEAPQHAETVLFNWDGRPGGVRNEQRLSPVPLVKADGGRRFLLAATDADASRRFWVSACIKETLARLHDAFEAYHQVWESSLMEGSTAEACEARWLRQHSVFYSGSLRRESEVRPLCDVNLVLALGVRLWPERQTAAEAATPENSRSSARWVSAGKEVASATPDPEHQRDGAFVKLLLVTDGCLEAADDIGRALEIISADEAAQAAPR